VERVFKAAQLGADDFVVKPFSFDDLAQRVAVQLYELDYTSLQRVLALLPSRETAQVPGLDLAKYRDWQAFVATDQGIEICALIRQGLNIDSAKALPKPQAQTQIVILKRTRLHWKCVWPHATGTTVASAA